MNTLAAALLLNLAGVQVSYHGGPVISKIRVVVVLWGPGTYVPEIARTSPAPSITDFYSRALESPYIDWLAEYNTSLGNRGTNQAIGRGELIGRFTIFPSTQKVIVSDADIQAEIIHQVTIGALPAPHQNESDYPQTYYAVFLPKEITAMNQGQTFCSYHNAMDSPFGHLYYVVHPDMPTLGARCGLHSFGLNTPFEVATYVASHELIESITDPVAGLAVSTGLPLSWYDANPGPEGKPIGEIGDICIYRDAAPTLPGTQYKVAPGWSNLADQCVVNSALNDFDLTIEPAPASLNDNQSASYTIHTRPTSGAGESIALYTTPLPAGFSVTISPNPIKSGASSTLVVTATQPPASPYVRFLLTGISPSTNHSVYAELLTTPAPVIRNASRATFRIASEGVFEVAASGTPLPALFASGLPSGLIFTDDGNGRGRIHGTPELGQVGTHTVTLSAQNSLLESASLMLLLLVEKGRQTLRVSGAPSTAFPHTSFDINVTGGASLSPIVLGVAGSCSTNGNTVTTGDAAGTCLVAASQAGDPNYAPASEEAIAVNVVTTNAGSCEAFPGPLTAVSLLTFACALRLFLRTKRPPRR